MLFRSGYDYAEVDITHRADLAQELNLFFPGTIICDDVKLVYPGKPELMAASIRTKQPNPGSMYYTPLPQGQVQRIVPLSLSTAAQVFKTCLPHTATDCFVRKERWLEQFDRGFYGYAGYVDDAIVAFAEILPEDAIPYPLPGKSSERGFITCLYSPNEHGLKLDYRQDLLRLALADPANPYREISIIAGIETPYPNGPEAVLLSAGFSRVKYMGPAMLSRKWEDAYLMRAGVRAEPKRA